MRSRILFLSLVALVSAAIACGNVETGGVTTGGGTPTPGAGDDDDDGSTVPTATPPQGVPAEAGGMAVFFRQRTHDANDMGGMVNFFPIPVPLPPTFADAWNDFPAHPMDTCERVYPSSVGLSTNITPPSAGEVSLEGPNGSFTLSELMGMYIAIWQSPDLFVPNTTYTIKATGGAIAPFQQPIQSPGEITVLNPDVSGANPFAINRYQDFTLTWSSVPDGRPLFLFFEQQDQPEQERWIFMCKITDDGSFTVPSSILQNFGPTVTPFPTEEWRDKFQLRRWHYSSFHPNGAVAPVLTAFETGWYGNIEFQ